MSQPPKIDRKSLKTPDDFVQKGTQVMSVLARYRTQVVPLLIVAAVGLLTAYAYDWWQGEKAEKAWKVYADVMKEKEPAKWDKLKALCNDFPKTRPMILAAAEVGDHYFDEAKKQVLKDPAANTPDAETAVQWYTKVLESPGLVNGEKQLLLINRAQSYEILKKYDDEMKDLTAASELGGDIKGLALLNQARANELKGDKTKALEIYEKVTADFLNTEYAKIAKNNMRRLKSPFFANPKI